MMEGGVWRAADMLEELKKRGWESEHSQNPVRAVEAAMNRLWKVKGEIERVGRGQYVYKSLPASPSSVRTWACSPSAATVAAATGSIGVGLSGAPVRPSGGDES